MGKAVILKKNLVQNVIVVDENTPKSLYDVELKETDVVSIGYEYKNGKFIAPKETEE